MPRNRRADETVLSLVTKNSESLKATVPAFIVSSLELGKGGVFRWRIGNSSLVIEIRRKKGDKES
jgi:hypothetical protein